MRTIVLIGLMGAGKSTVGRRLATRLGMPFVDADHEIERAAGMTIPEIFAQRGEAEFRDGERRVIARLLAEPPHVLATGGGAYMDLRTRDAIRNTGLAIWLKADLDALHERVLRRSNRPLLAGGNPRQVLERLMTERYPIYAEADITVQSAEAPPEVTVDRIIAALAEHARVAAA